jgi:uncharacterized membrane protein YjgN (DUF898 family)
MNKKDAAAARCLYEVASCRLGRNLYREAAAAGEASLAMRATMEKPSGRETLLTRALLSEAYLQAGEFERAEAAFQSVSQWALPDNRFLLVGAADKLASIYEERGALPEAARKIELALASAELAGPNRPNQAERMLHLSRLYQRMGRMEDANRMNGAAMRESFRDGTSSRVLHFIGYALLFGPTFGSLILALLYHWRARKVDQRLARLFTPPSIEVPAAPEMIAPETSLAVQTGGDTVESSEPVPPPPTQTMKPPPAAVTKVELGADGSVLFAMRVLNLLLSMLTLGVYSFWGKAKVRRYVCGQAEYQGDRFAFHGNGKELLLGWVRALPALVFILLFPNILPLMWQHPYSIFVAEGAALAAFLLLWPVARVGAYRYRLNRMSWRAIRFSYRGSALRYLGTCIGGTLLSVATFGLYVPFLQVRLRRLLSGQTYLGDGGFQFKGRGRELLGAWLVALPLCLCTFGLGWAWWSALRHRYCWANTTFAGGRFRCTATGGGLLRLWLGNLFIIIPTVGLGMSWAMLRTLRFWTNHVELVGAGSVDSICQDSRATTALGESFADFLGFDFGF